MNKRNFGRRLELTRRKLLKIGFIGGAAMFIPWNMKFKLPEALAAPILGPSLAPVDVAKYVTPMLIPPVMPKAPSGLGKVGPGVDYYEIGVSQFQQQILPPGLPDTTVWGYGPARAKGRKSNRISNAPSLTIEAIQGRPVRVKWVNELVDAKGNYLPHLLAVDPTLHWANPGGAIDTRPDFGDKEYVQTFKPAGADEIDTENQYTRYWGPVPMITHVHGAVGVGDESDGYPEAWYLPVANNMPNDYATKGTWYDYFAGKAAANFGASWGPGFATFQYPNLNRASTLWYHDHTLGMTRLNVYAGPAGFYLIRGGPDGDDAVTDNRFGTPAILPGPAPKENDKFPSKDPYYEIPIAIQDRSFNTDGSLFYPNSREFFDEIVSPYIPGEFSPIWNPEFFGNMMMVNGNTWPYQTVEQRRYRLRFLNGCQSRFLILDFSEIIDNGGEAWVIGNEGGFLKTPFNLNTTELSDGQINKYPQQLLMALAERADLIVDFTNVPEGKYVLKNVGPDEPFGGGVPINESGEGDFDPADPESTGLIMQFRVVPAVAADPTTPPQFLKLPDIIALPDEVRTRKLALIEEAGFGEGEARIEIEGPVAALLGTVGPVSIDDITPKNQWTGRLWMNPVTENPAVGDTEIWEIYNTTGDAHPMHVHELVFEVMNREDVYVDEDNNTVEAKGENITGPEPWETGFKDMVIAYPGQVTRIKAQFNTRGTYVWHCHIVEHEDNEMMRPYRIGDIQDGQPRT